MPRRFCHILSAMRISLFMLALSLGGGMASAAPISLQATSVSTNPCGFTLSGDAFSFSGSYSPCSQLLYSNTSSGALLTPSASVYGPTYGQAEGQKLALGSINLPENPGRTAVVTGAISAISPYELSVPISFVPVQLSGLVRLTGTLSACLLPANVVVDAPCDPQYQNFAEIHVDVLGPDVFSLNPRPITGTVVNYQYTEQYIGTAAAVPEPSTWACFGLGCALMLFLSRKRVREHHLRHASAALLQ